MGVGSCDVGVGSCDSQGRYIYFCLVTNSKGNDATTMTLSLHGESCDVGVGSCDVGGHVVWGSHDEDRILVYSHMM